MWGSNSQKTQPALLLLVGNLGWKYFWKWVCSKALSVEVLQFRFFSTEGTKIQTVAYNCYSFLPRCGYGDRNCGWTVAGDQKLRSTVHASLSSLVCKYGLPGLAFCSISKGLKSLVMVLVVINFLRSSSSKHATVSSRCFAQQRKNVLVTHEMPTFWGGVGEITMSNRVARCYVFKPFGYKSISRRKLRTKCKRNK